jgi:hypothetical protein
LLATGDMPIRDIKAKMAHHIAAVTPGLVQLLLRGYLVFTISGMLHNLWFQCCISGYSLSSGMDAGRGSGCSASG